MKKYIISIFLLIFISTKISAQNLVPNPGFEIIDTYDLENGAIWAGQVASWDSPTDGSPDAFATCSTSWITSIPSSGFGYQYPHSGNGYSGEGFFDRNHINRIRK